MASRTASTTDTRNQLEALMKRWETRRRIQRLVLLLPRLLMATFAVGIIVSLIIGLLRLAFAPQLLLLTGIAMSVTLVSLITGLGLLGYGGIEAARYFDQAFELQERLSTAFELIDGRIRTTGEIAARQIDDTYQHVQNIDPAKRLRLRANWVEWALTLGVLILLIVIVALMAFNVGTGTGSGISSATQTAIGAAADDTRDITEDLATDSGLTDEERSALLDSTERTLAELNNPETSAEESFAAMSELESDLREQADAIENESAEQQAGLQAAADALSQAANSGGQSLAQALDDWNEALENTTEEQQRELAERLARAAQAAQQSNPQLSQQLQQAGEAVQSGDISAAQQALSETAQAAESAQEQAQQRAETAQSLQESAEQTQSGSQEIARADSGSTDQQGEAETQTELEQMLAEQAGEIPGMDGESGGGEGDPSSEGEQGSAAQSEEGTTAQAEGGGEEGGEQQSDQSGSGDSDEGGEGGGAGDSSASQRSQEQSGSATSADSNNNPDGEGESAFEQIFTPRQQQNSTFGSTVVELEADGSGAPGIEGEFQQNPDGSASVPYNQVFQTYAEGANRALESDYVPLGVRDVVRDYFTSIEPTGSSDE